MSAAEAALTRVRRDRKVLLEGERIRVFTHDGTLDVDGVNELRPFEDEIRHLLRGERGERGHAVEPLAVPETSTTPWPEPLAPEAYYGLAGEIVQTIEPHTEADPAGLLVTLIEMVGNCIGRTPYFPVESDMHRLNLNIIMMGDTSNGRKGVAANRVRAVMREVDPAWEGTRIMGGMSSGEGLIWQVRDEIRKWQYDRKTGESVEIIDDPGVKDKRLMVVETEYASVLRVLQRDGNTLSPTIRDAWDGKSLRTMTKNSPAVATNPHISIIGHITRTELLRYMDSTEMANGFLNRFMLVCVKRSKSLPDGGGAVDLAPFVTRLTDVVSFARKTGCMERDTKARNLWHEVYPDLTGGKSGMMGAIVARAAPTVVRLSMLYALLSKSSVIRAEHLHAALAVWKYAEASALYIFGDALGDPVADDILRALRMAPGGLTRTDIFSGLFGRNQSSARIGRALALLAEGGLARCEREDTGGRPGERWFVGRRDQNA